MSGAERKQVEIYTDGSCVDPKIGGWAALIRLSGETHELTGAQDQCDNHTMELLAIVRALEFIKGPADITLFTDSQYAARGVQLLSGCLLLGGVPSAPCKRLRPLDEPLWGRVGPALVGKNLTLHWIKGHSGNPDNSRVDWLAKRATRDFIRQQRLTERRPSVSSELINRLQNQMAGLPEGKKPYSHLHDCIHTLAQARRGKNPKVIETAALSLAAAALQLIEPVPAPKATPAKPNVQKPAATPVKPKPKKPAQPAKAPSPTP